MSNITPCLWFDGNAEEAANFYASLFPDSHIDAVHRAPSDYPSGKTGGCADGRVHADGSAVYRPEWRTAIPVQ